MLWGKSFHIIFVVSRFAGLFYLPRIFVNHAMSAEPADKPNEPGPTYSPHSLQLPQNPA